jgi:hypothetical protein
MKIILFILISIFAINKVAISSYKKENISQKVSDNYTKNNENLDNILVTITNLIIQENYDALKLIMSLNNLDLFDFYESDFTIIQEIISNRGIEFIKKALKDIPDINRVIDIDTGNIMDYVIYLISKNKNSLKLKLVLEVVEKRGGFSINKLRKKLFYAVMEDDKIKVKNLLKQKVTLEGAYDYSYFNDKKYSFVEKFNKFRKLGIDFNKVEIPYYISKTKNDFNKRKKYFDIMISNKNINKITMFGSLLIISITSNDLDAFKYLIKKGAKINTRECLAGIHIMNHGYMCNKSPLFLAIEKGNLEIIKILLELDAVVVNEDIISAIKSEKRELIIKEMIKHNINFKFVDSPNYFIEGNKFDYDKNIENANTKTTPLILALKLKHYKIVKMIYNRTYLNYIEEITNKTALNYAIESKNKEIVNYLKKHGAKRACEILKTKCEPIKGDE